MNTSTALPSFTPLQEATEAYVLLSAMGGSFGDCVLVLPVLFEALENQSLEGVPGSILDELTQNDEGEPSVLRNDFRDSWEAMDSQEFICLISNLEYRKKPLTCAFKTSLSGMANYAREKGLTILGEKFD